MKNKKKLIPFGILLIIVFFILALLVSDPDHTIEKEKTESATPRPQAAASLPLKPSPTPSLSLFDDFEKILGSEYVHQQDVGGVHIPEHMAVIRKIEGKDFDFKIFEWESVSDYQVIGKFKKDLAQKGNPVGWIFPYINAAPTYPSAELYIENDQGKFYRYITYFAQEEGVPDLNTFTYIIQGFTKEGNYIHANVQDIEVTKEKNKYNPKTNLLVLDTEVFSIIAEIN